MSPAVKYTLGRLGLFVVVFVMLLPVPLHILVKAMIALVASAAFSYFLLAKWRNEMAEQLGAAAQRRAAEKQRLRAALAGDEDAAAAGDRAAAQAQPAKAQPAKAQPAKVQPAKAQPAKVQPAKVQPAKAQPAKAQPAKAEAGKAEAGKDGPAQAV